MSELTTVARPYAKAAFDYAVEHQAVDKWSEMVAFAAAVADNDAMAPVLVSEAAPAELAELFVQVCGDQLDEHGQNFIRILAENGRLRALPDIAVLFNEMVTEHQKTVDVTVVSAAELDDAEKERISKSMSERLARKVSLQCTVDESLIGGMIIQAGDTVIDSSYRGKLERLTETLQS